MYDSHRIMLKNLLKLKNEHEINEFSAFSLCNLQKHKLLNHCNFLKLVFKCFRVVMNKTLVRNMLLKNFV